MSERPRARLVAYGLAVLGPAVSLLVRLYVSPEVMDERALYIAFCPAVLIAAYLGGFQPGLLATLLSAAAVAYFFLDPSYDLRVGNLHDAVALGFFILVGSFISFLSESLHRSRGRIAASERRYAVTLASIGDAVIATDIRGRVTFLNPVAEALTGWPKGDAVGRPLAEVFRIVNEQTRQPVEDPAAKVLRLGTVVGLANHTALLARDGRETPIDDSGAPILDGRGGTAGVVLVFRDTTQRRRAEEAEVLRRANTRLELALRNSNIYVWELDMPDGVPENGRLTAINLWEQLGHERPTAPSDDATSIALLHPEDRAPLETAMRRYLAGEAGEYEVECRLRHKDGSYRWMLTRGVAVRDGGGEPIRVVGSGVDITDLMRAGEVLRASEARFRALAQNSSDIISLFDAEGTVLYQSPSIERLLGYRPQDRIGLNVFRDPIVHPDDREAKRAFFDTARNHPGAPVPAEFRLRHADGSWRDIEAIGQNFLHEPGVAGIVANYRDVTERKRAEEASRASEQRFRTLARATNDAVWDWDLGTNQVWWNEGVLTLFGYRLEQNEADPSWWLERIHPEDREAVEAFFFDVVRGKELSWVDEYRFRCADGSYKDVYDRGYVLRDAEGQATRMIGAMLDITERKRAEESLRESERRFRTLTEALPHMVWTAGPDGAIDYSNARTTEYTGLTPEQLRGWDWQPSVHPEDLPRYFELWTRSIATGEPYEIEQRLRRVDGAFRWHRSMGLALRDGSGRITEWVVSCIDIDDQNRAQQTLREAKEAAEAASRAKDEFLANVSHEIRTPMNAILGMTELALDTPLTEDQRQYLKTVKSAADNLLDIINDLLDFSKIEAGKLELDLADFSPRAAVGDTLRALAVRAHTKGLELIYDVQPEVPDALVGDTGRLRQVLLNLVGNAIKFTDAGEVEVSVEVADEAAPEGEVGLRFAVRDTGIGIPRDQQERIFRAFEQEDTSTTRRYGGTGLGLSIAARLVALMGGTITVQSEPGRGSTFAFTAQFGRQPHPTEPVAVRPPVLLRDLRVLVVDDNPTNRHILEEWLRGWQMDPTAVGDGLAAMGALWDAASLGRPYPLVLLDARMPDTDGLALAARIRERAALSAIRIILLTSGDRPGDSARSRELRIDAHLLKPVLQDELLEAIFRVMNRAGGNAPPTAGPPGGREPVPAVAPLRILVAEDNEFNAQLLEHLVTRRGHRVRLATNGREALTLAGEGGFDLLLLDVHMPELDGFQVVRAIRERERSAGGHLPVIALTARSRNEDRDRCLAAGMDDFLAKPIGPAELFAAIERVLAGRPASQAPRDSSPGPGILLDPTTLLAACDDDPVLLGKLIGIFRNNLPGSLARVQEAIARQDPAHLRESAHQLRGMLPSFSATAAQAAARLEAMGAGGELGEAASSFETLAELIERLGPLLDGLSIEALRAQAGAADVDRSGRSPIHSGRAPGSG